MNHDWILGEGPIPCNLMIIGEGPGPQEIKQGRPFVGMSGIELNNYLKRFTGLNREDVYITNVIKYATEKKETDEMMTALLMEEIEKVQPRVILALGAIATHQFVSNEWDMETLNAIPHEWSERIVIPCFHPAAAMRDTPLMAWIIEAFKVTKDALEGTTIPWKEEQETEIVSLFTDCDEGNLWAVDTETMKNGDPFLVTMTSVEGRATRLYHAEISDLYLFNEMIRKKIVILHNALFDLPILWRCGVYPRRWIDTMVVAFLLQTLPLGLKSLAYKLCGMKMKSYEEITQGKDWDEIDLPEVIQYACADADATLRVYNAMLPQWYDGMDKILQRDVEIMPMIIDMMERGMLIDKEYMENLGGEFEVGNLELQAEIAKIAQREFNPASAPQTADLLYKRLKLGKGKKIAKTKWGGSTNKKSLAKIRGEHPVVKMIEEWREIDTLQDKFLGILPKKVRSDGRIYTKLSMVRVKHSGRLASSGPNLMAQPTRTEDGRKIRNGFITSEGYKLVSFDYNQIEMRLMAHLSQDPVMLKIYEEGGDIHTETAMRIFKIKDPKDVDEMKHRYPSKRAGFGIINSISAHGLAADLEAEGATGWTEEKCRELLNAWFKVYDGVRCFMNDTATATRRYRSVTDMWGRMELIPEIISAFPHIVDAGLRRAGNQGIQSGAQGIIKEAMRRLWPMIEEWNKRHDDLVGGKSVCPLLQIHDDLLFEIKTELINLIAPQIREVMEDAVKLSIPIIVDVKIGNRWGEMQKWK